MGDKEKIIEEILSDTSRKMNENYIKNTSIYGDFLIYKNSLDFEDYKFGEIFYHYINSLKSPIKCYKDSCNKKPKYESINRGFRKYCSNKCKSSCSKFRKVVKNTVIEKYNVDNVFKSKTIKDKIKKTNCEKYGVEYISQSNSVKKKINNTINKTFNGKFSSYNIIDKNENNITMLCDTCDSESVINRTTLYSRFSKGYDLCLTCKPLNSISISSYETEIVDYIKSIYGGDIIQSNRELIKPYELDIYLPKYNLAIEFNGLYFHSEIFKDKNYHLNKTKLCNKKDIDLIHIFEDEWLYKKDIIKSIIKNRLGKCDNIYARKCIIKEVCPKDSRKFLNENHIQGFVPSKIKIGLYYNDVLVSLMTFGSLRKILNNKTNNGSFELLRFCNKKGISVVGGASKLFNYFIKNFEYKKIISYCNLSKYNGTVYEKLRFKYISTSLPNYYYINIKTNEIKRHYRWKFRKSELVKLGYDKTKTEFQIMKDIGYYKIYDVGNNKYEFNFVSY